MSSIQQIGQYRIEAQLSGDAYRAVDMVRRRPVTLRIIDPGRFADAQALQRFLQQAQAAADLVHPHLAWVWETGEDGGYIYVAERHIPAWTLRRQLDEAGPLSWADASRAVEQLASGLDFLHGRSRVHGRVRPDTIYLSAELGAVLGGFGASSPLADQNDPETVDARRYSAPEAASGAAADRYALACVLAEMLTGRPIFDAASVEQVAAQQQAELNFPAAWPPGTPWQIEPVLERALAVRPEQRFDSAAGLAAAPALWAAHASADDEPERLRRESLWQQRRAADADARRRAEETARLAALEQARREVEDQAQVEPISAQADGEIFAAGETAAEITGDEQQAVASAAAAAAAEADAASSGAGMPRRRSRAQTPPRSNRGRWWLGLLAAALAIAFFLAWNSGRLGALAPTQTPTASFTVTVASTRQPAVATVRASSTPQPTAAPTFTATATRRPTATRSPTRTPTASPSSTATQRPATSTPERQERPEEDNSLLD